jgi:hypothetical protein
MNIGQVVRLRVDCLGNPKGTFGVCYENYNIGHEGASVIFENGNYDGFSKDEQESFLEDAGFDQSVADYQFQNVMKLSQDFDQGVFNIALLRGKGEFK